MKVLFLCLLGCLFRIDPAHASVKEETMLCSEGLYVNDLGVELNEQNRLFNVTRSGRDGNTQVIASGLAKLRNSMPDLQIYELYTIDKDTEQPVLSGLLIPGRRHSGQSSKLVLGNTHTDLMSCWKSSN